MSNIVAFKLDRKSRSADAEPHVGGAQILFFTGIRYVRLSDADLAVDDEAMPDIEAHGAVARDGVACEASERLKA